jgi:hypothetical protein
MSLRAAAWLAWSLAGLSVAMFPHTSHSPVAPPPRGARCKECPILPEGHGTRNEQHNELPRP